LLNVPYMRGLQPEFNMENTSAVSMEMEEMQL